VNLSNPTHKQRILRLTVASLVFLAGSTAIIILVFRGYLGPAYEAWRKATPQQKHLLSASSTLLLAVVLVVLLLLLIALFGVRRYFHFHQMRSRSKTEYVDAWAESAKRMNAPKEDDA
jgi:H+/Cl- antiporter ClcA